MDKSVPLILKNITFSYETGFHLIDNFSFVFERSKAYLIQGPSGCGKTTLLKIIGKQVTPQSGEIFYPQDLKRFSWIYAQSGLIEELSVRENILLDWPATSEREKAFQQHLNFFGLMNLENALPGRLSSGQQQRVAIIRALMMQKSFILADEPTAHLDSKRSRELMSSIIDACHLHDYCLICVSHDQSLHDLFDQTLDITTFQKFL